MSLQTSKKVPTVSIGIPAYNEESNILDLLLSMVSQKQNYCKILEIIVISDGSTDATVAQAESVKSDLIKVIPSRERLGQQERQNQLVSMYQGDILVIIEADTLPAQDNAIDELVSPFIRSTDSALGMVVGVSVSVVPDIFYERIQYYGQLFKKTLFEEWKRGVNIYTCGGHSMRAFSRSFTKDLRWPTHVPEDSYVYLRLIELSKTFIVAPKAIALMKNVTNLRDRKKQSEKFVSGREKLKSFFSPEMVEKEYNPPRLLVLKHLILSLIRHPLWTVSYLIEFVFNRVFNVNMQGYDALYDPYTSTKKLKSHSSLASNLTFENRSLRDKATVVVGIPAYNEERNIKNLLTALSLQQTSSNIVLTRIIVVSDGSTDHTVENAKQIQDSRIVVVENSERKGVNDAQNTICRMASEDILVLLDGDVVPVGHDFLDNITEPFICNPDLGLVGGDVVPAKPVTFFESVTVWSHSMKSYMYKKINKRDNIHLCHGRARALSRAFYKNLYWPGGYPEDAFSYLACMYRGFQFYFADNAKVIFRSPRTLQDHLKQSYRFVWGKKKMYQYFGAKIVRSSYHISAILFVITFLRFFFLNPLLTISASGVLALSRFKANFGVIPDYQQIWDVSETSKRVAL